MCHQGAFEPVKMWADGRTPGSPSVAPSGTQTSSPAVFGTTEPQRLQKSRTTPGEDS